MTQSRMNGFIAPLCLLATGTLIGSTANAAKLAGSLSLDPMTFLTWTVLGASLVLTVVARSFGQWPTLDRRTGEYFVVSGLLSVALPNAMAFLAISQVGAGFVALSFAFPPLFTYLLALFARLEGLRLLRAVGVSLGVVGAIILARSKLAEPGGDPYGIALALGMPIVVASGNIYRTLRWPPGASALALAPGMLLGASLFLVTYSALSGKILDVPFDRTPVALLLIWQTITFSTMYVLYFILQRVAGVLYLTQIGSVGAIAGAAIAVVVFGEALPPVLPVAALFIAAGVYLVTQTAPATRPESKLA